MFQVTNKAPNCEFYWCEHCKALLQHKDLTVSFAKGELSPTLNHVTCNTKIKREDKIL